MNTEKLYTHSEMSNILGVSVTTIKSYRRKFPGCIPVANQGKPIRFTQTALNVSTRIRDLFATGMSVPEVRARLAAEFDWIEAEVPASEEPAAESTRLELPPLYTSAMSDMAQSLVGLAQKQGTVLSRLEELGSVITTPQAGAPVIPGAPVNPCPAASPVLPGSANIDRPDWLSELGELHQRFAATVSHLHDAITRLNQWAHMFSEKSLPHSGTAPAAQTAPAPMAEAQQPRQPGRAFMALPLVVTGQDGMLHGLAGQGRGRFTCADIRAMVSAAAPENACLLEWNELGQDWLLTVHDQREGCQTDVPLAEVLLREVADSVGNTAALLHRVRIGGEERGPTDFFMFLRDRMG